MGPSPDFSSAEGQDRPRPAATLVVLREGAAGLEVLLTVRPDTMRFMGGAIVFPGGAVDRSDRHGSWTGAIDISPTQAKESLGEPDEDLALGYYVTALREAYEEVGLLLGRGPLERVHRTDAEDPAAFRNACAQLGVTLAAGSLVPAGRWVTPFGSPIRFDTRFFLTASPPGWEPSPHEREVADCYWATPADALDRLASGESLMAPPTIEMLQRLQSYADVGSALDAMRDSSPDQPEVLSVRLSPLVHIVLAPNPGIMTGPGTNTYVVGSGPTAVIDPAVNDDAYVEAVLKAAGEIDVVLVTHRHPDHVGGAKVISERAGVAVRAFGSDPAGGVGVVPLLDDEVIELGGASLRAIHSPGHASDHLCFYMEGTASLFAGDNILGEGTAVIAPPDGDMRAYLSSLKRLRWLHIDRVYPGHFRPLPGGESVIDGYIAHRMAREEAIVATFESGALDVEEIVEAVYTDVAPALHPIARFTVLAHLEMLEEEGRVRREGDLWSRAR